MVADETLPKSAPTFAVTDLRAGETLFDLAGPTEAPCRVFSQIRAWGASEIRLSGGSWPEIWVERIDVIHPATRSGEFATSKESIVALTGSVLRSAQSVLAVAPVAAETGSLADFTKLLARAAALEWKVELVRAETHSARLRAGEAILSVSTGSRA